MDTDFIFLDHLRFRSLFDFSLKILQDQSVQDQSGEPDSGTIFHEGESAEW